jgi:hypothetical protein
MGYFMIERRSELMRKILEDKIYLKRYRIKNFKGNSQIPQHHIHYFGKQPNSEPSRAGNGTAKS